MYRPPAHCHRAFCAHIHLVRVKCPRCDAYSSPLWPSPSACSSPVAPLPPTTTSRRQSRRGTQRSTRRWTRTEPGPIALSPFTIPPDRNRDTPVQLISGSGWPRLARPMVSTSAFDLHPRLPWFPASYEGQGGTSAPCIIYPPPAVAQWIECFPPKEDVAGSTPVGRANFLPLSIQTRRFGQIKPRFDAKNLVIHDDRWTSGKHFGPDATWVGDNTFVLHRGVARRFRSCSARSDLVADARRPCSKESGASTLSGPRLIIPNAMWKRGKQTRPDAMGL